MREPSLRRKVFLFSLATFALKASLPSPMDRGGWDGSERSRGREGEEEGREGEEEGKVG